VAFIFCVTLKKATLLCVTQKIKATIRPQWKVPCKQANIVILIFETMFYCTAENRLVNKPDWNQPKVSVVWKQTPNSCPVVAVQILLKSLEECKYNATQFSWPHRPAVLYNFLCWLSILLAFKSRQILTALHCTFNQNLVGSRAGLKSWGARGNFYWRAPMA